MRTSIVLALFLSVFVTFTPPAAAQAGGPVYELRTYTTLEGRLPALLARFRDHTVRLFEKHSIESIGYWVPADPPRSQNTLIYLLRHKSREAAAASWAAFRNDPEWQRVQKESEASGKIVEKVESVYLNATDFSKLR
mgnify:CR=1 FL=1